MYDTSKINKNYVKEYNNITVWSMRRVDYIFINKLIRLKYYVNRNIASDHYLIYVDILIFK